MQSDNNPFLTLSEPVMDTQTHTCVCQECITGRIRQRIQQHALFQLRSAVAGFIRSTQTYEDLARLSYYYRLTLDEPANSDSWEP